MTNADHGLDGARAQQPGYGTQAPDGQPTAPYVGQPGNGNAHVNPDGYGNPGGYANPGGYGNPGGYANPGGHVNPGGQIGPGGYGHQPPAYAPYAPAAPTNTLAIMTIIAAFVFPVVGIVTGHIALGQLRTSGEQGEGLAKAGLIISYVYSGLIVLIILVSIIAPFLLFAMMAPFFASVPTGP